MPQRPLSESKYEANNILFDYNVGLLIRFYLFLHADNFFFRDAHEMILMGLPGGGIKRDENSRNQNLDSIISCVSPEMKDIPIDKQVWFQTLQEQKLLANYNR